MYGATYLNTGGGGYIQTGPIGTLQSEADKQFGGKAVWISWAMCTHTIMANILSHTNFTTNLPHIDYKSEDLLAILILKQIVILRTGERTFEL